MLYSAAVAAAAAASARTVVAATEVGRLPADDDVAAEPPPRNAPAASALSSFAASSDEYLKRKQMMQNANLFYILPLTRPTSREFSRIRERRQAKNENKATSDRRAYKTAVGGREAPRKNRARDRCAHAKIERT